MDSFEHKGVWWIPETDRGTFVGTLSFDPVNGGVLNLTEKIEDIGTPPAIPDFAEYPVMYGHVGFPVTLLGCYVKSIPGFGLSGYHDVEITVESIHLNHYLSNVEENVDEESSLSYSKLTLSYTHLNEWMGQVGFIEEQGSFRRKRFEPVEIEIADRNDKLTFWYGNTKKQSSSELKLKNQARITIERRDYCQFSNYQWYTHFSLANLLTVATGEPNFPFNIQAKTKDGNFRTDIFYKTPGYLDDPKLISQRDMLFTLDDLGDEFPVCLSAWMKKHYRLWLSTDLYIQTVYNPTLRPTTKFLLLAQALESYHSNSNHKDKYCSSAKFKRIARTVKCAIPEGVDEPLLSNLKARIGGANKFSLESRLIDICDILSDYSSGPIFDVVGDRVEFAKAVKKARNQLTHHPVKEFDNYAELLQSGLKLTNSMEVLLRLCLLAELELSREKTAELMSRFVSKKKNYLEPVW